MATRRKTTASAVATPSPAPAAPTAGEEVEYEDYRKKFEPVAPWKRDDIPDYGPIKDHTHLGIFVLIGVVATLGYEYYAELFDEIPRVLAYVAIWFPLWFRLLTRVSPQLSEEEIEANEKLAFKKELERIQKEAESVDD